jgi:hypothetical protein
LSKVCPKIEIWNVEKRERFNTSKNKIETGTRRSKENDEPIRVKTQEHGIELQNFAVNNGNVGIMEHLKT